MAKLSRPRRGSLQFYPRKRVSKFLPGVNWSSIDSPSPGFLGFIAYKVGMATAFVKDTTDKSMTLNKRIYLPVTILEVPNMKIFSVRFYKNGIVSKEIVVSHDKALKKILKTPKTLPNFEAQIPKEYDDIRVIVYSVSSQTGLKKTPDIIELGIKSDNKLEFIRKHINKELSLTDFLNDKISLLDVRGLTKGKGFSGPMKRFGVGRRQHKSEKGVHKVGSIGPWHPAHVVFRTPMAGQLGMFTRVHYNLKVIGHGKISDKNINPKSGFRHYGNIHSDYIILKGSVQGPQKRQILLTVPSRPTKSTLKKKYELQEIVA